MTTEDANEQADESSASRRSSSVSDAQVGNDWASPATVEVVDPGISLAQTCGPSAWSGGRWPHTAWIGGRFVWVGWNHDRSGSTGAPTDRPTVRVVRQSGLGRLQIASSSVGAAEWAARALGVGQTCPAFDDPVLERLRQRFAGLRPLSEGDLFAGLVLAIVGQSISVASAAITGGRLAALFHPGLEVLGRRFTPLPRADQLAAASPALVRTSGVTWRRAEALVAAGRAAAAGLLPMTNGAGGDPDAVRSALRALPLVGPWTCEATLLWGLGWPDAHCTGDVALLRAVRRACDRPDLTLRDLDRLAEGWRPARAWAARLLWTDLLGEAPMP